MTEQPKKVFFFFVFKKRKVFRKELRFAAAFMKFTWVLELASSPSSSLSRPPSALPAIWKWMWVGGVASFRATYSCVRGQVCVWLQKSVKWSIKTQLFQERVPHLVVVVTVGFCAAIGGKRPGGGWSWCWGAAAGKRMMGWRRCAFFSFSWGFGNFFLFFKLFSVWQVLQTQFYPQCLVL